MRSKRTFQHPTEVGGTHRVEIAIQHIGEVTFFQRQDLAGVTNHMRVRLRRRHIHHHRRVEDIDRRILDKRRLHITIAIPLRLAIAQAYPVDHPVAKERVVTVTGQRVGAVAQVATIKLSRNGAGHLKVS